MLPLQEAFDTIRSRRMTQQAAHARLNQELSKLGCGRVSMSGFNRWAMRVRSGEKRRPVVKLVKTPASEPGKRAVVSPGGDGHAMLLYLFDAIVEKLSGTLAEIYQMKAEHPEIFSRPERPKSRKKL